MREEAERYLLGEKKFGRDNWKNGNVKYIRDRYNHMFEHMLNMRDPRNVDNNLAAIRWATSALIWFRDNRTDMFKEAMYGQTQVVAVTRKVKKTGPRKRAGRKR